MCLIRSLLFLGVLLLNSSCGVNYEIVTHKAKNTNFNTYKTYEINHDHHGFEQGSKIINGERVDKAIEKELHDLGYTFSLNSDMEIFWFMKVDTRIEQGIYNVYNRNWRHPRPIEVYEYQEESLVIEILDSNTYEMIWRAKVSNRIYNNMPDLENRIDEVVEEVFNKYKKDTGLINSGYVAK